MTDPTTFVSLFSGVGGFDMGLEAAGWQCVAQVEWDKHCLNVLHHHWPDVPKWADVRTVHGANLPVADVVAFGSPCQDLSLAGTRSGFVDGGTSNLFFEAVRVIKEMRDATSGMYPRIVVWENVAGSLSSNKGEDFAAVLDTLADIGAVDIGWRVLDARWFGVPQRRRRVFVVADFVGGCGQSLFVEPESVCRDFAARRLSWTNNPSRLEGTVGACSEPPVAFGAKEGAHVGYHWTDEAPTLKTTTTVGVVYALHESQRQGIGVAKHFPTLNVAGGKPGQGYAAALIGETVRRLTPVECERLMGWPDGHTAVGADGKLVAETNRYKMCGNGVASPVAEWVALNINWVLGNEQENEDG